MKTRMLQPVKVDEVTEISGVQTVSVTYNGGANLDARRPSKIGIFSGGIRSRFNMERVGEIQNGERKSETTVRYYFNKGWFVKSPEKRAEKFQKDVADAIENFVPVYVGGLVKENRSVCFSVQYEWRVCQNPLFDYYINHQGADSVRKWLAEANDGESFVREVMFRFRGGDYDKRAAALWDSLKQQLLQKDQGM